MNKQLKLIAAAAVLAFGSANAATTGPTNFNVVVNLTSTCSLSAVSDVTFSYTSFQPGAAVATPGNFTVSCTNGVPYTMVLDAAGGTVIGLNYTVALSSAGGTGNGAAQAYTVTGGMVASQGGNCAGATCVGTSVRTVTVNY